MSWKRKTPRRNCACCSRPAPLLAARGPRLPSGKRTAISPSRNSHARTMKSTRWSGRRSLCPSRRNLGSPFPNPVSKTSPASLCSSCDASTATGERRIPFLSAMSMLGSKDNETQSYLEIVDALRQHGAAPQADMEALWRRLVFNILISNTDDHLRNHGFLYEGQAGWRLSPAYDLNPVPTDIKPRILSTAINEDDNTASLALAMEVAGYFELDDGTARDIAKQVGKAVSKWRDEAARHGLNKSEMDRMASAFEHDDLRAAQQDGSAKV